MKERDIPNIGPISFPDAVPDDEILKLTGYAEACDDYGIWREGRQVIGCMEIGIKEAIMRKVMETIDKFGGYKSSDLVL